MQGVLFILEQGAKLADIASSLILFLGFFACLWAFFKAVFRYGVSSQDFIKSMSQVRLNLGNYLLFGLEIMIVADVIHTVLDPTFEDILLILIIVLIRVIISYSLSKEMDALREGK